MSGKTGWDLVVEVFGEELAEEIMDIRDINYLSGVTEWNTEFLYQEGWYNHYEVKFKYNNKYYQFEYKSHNSDNVCDTESDTDSFKEAPREIWIVVTVNHHYPSVSHFHSEKEARENYEAEKEHGFVVHLAKVENFHYDDERGYGQEREDDINTWDVYWS